MVAFLFMVWQVIAFVLFGLWAAKFLANLPSISIAAGVMSRRSVGTYWYYYRSFLWLIARDCVFSMPKLLRQERSQYFFTYSKYSVIKYTLLGIREVSA